MNDYKACPEFAPHKVLPVTDHASLKLSKSTMAAIERRNVGVYCGRGFWLSNAYQWAIVKDDQDSLVLVARDPLEKFSTMVIEMPMPPSDWVDTDDDADNGECGEPACDECYLDTDEEA